MSRSGGLAKAAALAVWLNTLPPQSALLAQEVPEPPPAAAARQAAESSSNEASNDFAIVGSGTFANGSIRGVAFDRRLILLGFKYSRVLVHNGTLRFRYTPEIVPAAWLSQPVWGRYHRAVRRSVPPLTHSETTYGAGASPIGFEVDFNPDGRLQPVVGTDEGFLYFSRNVPSLFSAQFNFTIEVRLGLRVSLDRARALSVEYVYHHLSNAHTARENPGVDSQMVSLGYSFGLSFLR